VGSGSLELEDSAASFGAVRVKCSIEMTGTIGPESEGKLTALTLTGCSVVKGTCEASKVTMIHLSWGAELGESESETRDNIKGGGSGSPGYTITCGKVEDTCEFEKVSTAVEDLATEGDVNLVFDSKSGKATCNHGEKCAVRSASGTVEGSIKVKAEAGEAVQETVIGVTAKRFGSDESLCTFTAVNQRCKIVVENVSTDEVTVSGAALQGTNGTTRFAIIPGECTIGTRLEPRGFMNNKCNTEVESTEMGTWVNNYQVTVTRGAISRVASVTLRM
jgi:uncharacterized protein affecting Mg2+/Co2+ transport